MSATPKQQEPRAWSPTLSLGLTALILIAVPWTLKLATAPRLGQPCGGGFDCAALDGRCVQGDDGGFCTVTCESDSDCPSSGYCGIPPHDRWQRWFSTSVVSQRFCVPGPRPKQPLEIDSTLPDSGEAGAQFRPPEQQGGLGGTQLRKLK